MARRTRKPTEQAPLVLVDVMRAVKHIKGLTLVKRPSGSYAIRATATGSGRTLRKQFEPTKAGAVADALAWLQEARRTLQEAPKPASKRRGMYPVRFAFLLDEAAHAEPHECVLWPFALDTKGMGQIGRLMHKERCHRVIGRMYHGPAEVYAQTCGNPRCFNPYHIKAFRTRSRFAEYAHQVHRAAVQKGLR